MPHYQIVLLIKPAGMFGLPEEGKTIHPAPVTNLYTGTLDSRTGNIISHGTLSKYRETPLQKEVTMGSASLKMKDNFVFLDIEAMTEWDAIEQGFGIANSLCVFLSVYTNRYCSFDIIQATQEPEGKRVQLPVAVFLTSMTLFNLEELAKCFDETTLAYSVSDDILDKGAAYFYHALFMREEMQHITSPLSFHAKLIISEVILNYHKAISTIIGDPSLDKDYQSRYRRFGISRRLWEDAEKIRGLRNNYDIAHYTPDLAALSNIDSHLGLSHKTAEQIIKAYIAWLKSKASVQTE
jgi:hypothetical protein